MKILKILGLILVLILAVILIGGLFAPNEMKYSQSVQIDAPVDVVWAHTNSLEAMDSWSPWVAKDPEAKAETSGESGAIGSKSCWDSNHEDVGAGCQEITKIDAPNRMETKMMFTRPYESSATSFVSLEEADGGTTVTWGFSGESPYPFNFFGQFMSMEDAVGEDFTNGLNSLKSMAEAAAKVIPDPIAEPEMDMEEHDHEGHDHESTEG